MTQHRCEGLSVLLVSSCGHANREVCSGCVCIVGLCCRTPTHVPSGKQERPKKNHSARSHECPELSVGHIFAWFWSPQGAAQEQVRRIEVARVVSSYFEHGQEHNVSSEGSWECIHQDGTQSTTPDRPAINIALLLPQVATRAQNDLSTKFNG